MTVLDYSWNIKFKRWQEILKCWAPRRSTGTMCFTTITDPLRTIVYIARYTSFAVYEYTIHVYVSPTGYYVCNVGTGNA